jgi:predicted enzyme related to lactoylglutathione lyase
MEKATGIGGVFFRSSDPAALHAWYSQHLGLPADNEGFAIIRWGGDVAGSTVWSPFPDDTDYFGDRSQQSMINYRVDDLDAMLAQLSAQDVPVIDKIEVLDGVGRFGWATDPEGNRFELWEPAPGT